MKTALIVDDATVMRIRLRDILEPKYKVIAEAADGEEAVRLYEKHAPDFVTLDITMQKLNGIEALEQIMDKHQDALIVIVSAMGQKKMVFDAISKGAKDFIIKPFEPDRVIAAIDRLFE
jgi:two-component system, chemotaxis family, chemotaxis protein CheY